MRLREDVDRRRALEKARGPIELDAVEHLACVGEGRLVDLRHAREDRIGALACIEGEVDVDVARAPLLLLGTRHLDLELLEPLESEFFTEAMHAGNRDMCRAGELLDGEAVQPAAERQHGAGELLLGGREALRQLHASLDVHGAPPYAEMVGLVSNEDIKTYQ